MAHVLLVDDDIELRTLSQKFLQGAGYNVVVVGDGWDAIREIVVNKPDIVVMDIEMPKLSGLNALDILRVSRLTDQIPVIVTSGHGDKDTILRAVQLGADDFIVKPYSYNELVSRIAVHLFQLDFKTLQAVLDSLKDIGNQNKPSWTGLDASQYQNWGAFTAVHAERELTILLQQGVTLDQAVHFNQEQAAHKIMVLAKFRSVWKCVWPVTAGLAALNKKAS
jgi:two-component system, OmpR family, response regulator MtrA